MTDSAPSPPQAPSHPDADAEKPSCYPLHLPPKIWAWLGIGMAIVLWFGSSAYFHQQQQERESAFQSGTIVAADYDLAVRRAARYAIICKISSGTFLLASLLFFVSRIDPHRRAPNT